MSDGLIRAVGDAVESPVVDWRPVATGAARARLTDGRQLFVKHRADAVVGMYEAEAQGLAWLGDAGALRVPTVAAVRDGTPPFIAMEWIAPGPPAPDHDERLGRGLAALHRAGAPSFGLPHDTFIATLPQENRPAPTWAEFYGSRRLAPLARRAADAGLLSARATDRIDRLIARLPDACGPDEPPARIHGDLWAGNAIVDSSGEPVLIDPAAHGGHREMDLAMMRLFGGFGARVFDAYREEHPPAAGHADRVALFQLWPLLVHVVLFGGGYATQLEAALARCP